MLRPSQEKVVKIIGDFLILSILVIMVYQSWKLSSRLEESTTPALSISEAWFGRAMIVGFIIMLYYKVRQLSVLFFGKGVSSDEAMEETGDQHE
jgi:TRAP-type C4-dicarboxylate transport system permease small subunit